MKRKILSITIQTLDENMRPECFYFDSFGQLVDWLLAI